MCMLNTTVWQVLCVCCLTFNVAQSREPISIFVVFRTTNADTGNETNQMRVNCVAIAVLQQQYSMQPSYGYGIENDLIEYISKLVLEKRKESACSSKCTMVYLHRPT